ncbi:conserved hypothetical protein [Ricinus communis]|uniref:Uncharacterized protein n=1 Tax=Ricinus communis TaxID=3988 RepID=B9TB19_RICCO|nr:conserved hypothetical protein [Ricinus communis]
MIGFDLGVLPAEVDLLESYLNRANQDPEWVQYVRTTLQNTPPPYFDRAFRSFLEIEMCSLTKEQIERVSDRATPLSGVLPTAFAGNYGATAAGSAVSGNA